MNGPVEGVMVDSGYIRMHASEKTPTYEFSVLVKFKSEEDMRRAIKDGICTFTVFE